MSPLNKHRRFIHRFDPALSHGECADVVQRKEVMQTALTNTPRYLRGTLPFEATRIGLVLLVFVALGSFQVALSRDFRIQLLSDIHYPAKILPASEREKAREKKDRALAHLAADKGIDLVVFLGDTVALTGASEQLQEARAFTSRLPQKTLVLAGNHELMYCPQLGVDGKLVRAAPELVLKNQERFVHLFKTPLTGTFSVAGYRFIYLAGDDENATQTVRLKASTLDWLDSELSANPKTPTIILCHAPLPGTLPEREGRPTKSNSFIHPAKGIQTLLERHRNVMAWVSGHTHTKAKAAGFNHPTNLYLGRILNIHCPSWERNHLYANSLFLGEGGVTVRTFDFEKRDWVKELDRRLAKP